MNRTRSALGGCAVVLTAIAAIAPTGTALGQSAGHIISQPARDVGLEKTKIPPLLERASDNPYALVGAADCAQIAGSIAALTKVLGPDFTASPSANRRNVAGIGGTAIVNSLIPFRGVVRAVSGADAADKRKLAAVDAGLARRGFLRGLQSARCRK